MSERVMASEGPVEPPVRLSPMGAEVDARGIEIATHVMLLGNPNSGKTTLFNALTGLTARAGNYPGVTVDFREGRLQLPSGRVTHVVDLPGTYSMVPRAEDEAVALRGLFGKLPNTPAPSLVVVACDASNLERNLYLLAQLREWRLPLLAALTMMDTVESDGRTVDVGLLERRVGVPVIPVSATKAGGTKRLLEAMDRALSTSTVAEPVVPPLTPSNPALPPLVLQVRAAGLDAGSDTLSSWLQAAVDAEAVTHLPVGGELQAALGAVPVDVAFVERLVAARWDRVKSWMDGVVAAPPGRSNEEAPSSRLTSRIDAIALHPVLGPLSMLAIFGALFQALFTWSVPLMDAIEAFVGLVADVAGGLVPADLPLVRSLVVDGLVAGAGNVIVFVPQIAVLFLFLGILEDSGYLARAAFLLDRLMSRVGLHGRAFVPLLSGFACAVPAIMATRTIENRKDRLVTILVTPLVSCSARLPVYGLMIATVFATTPPVFGFLNPGTVVMVAMYSLSIGAAIGMALVFKRTLLKSPPPPFVLELPLYRLPRAGQLARHVGSKVRSFLVDAGTVILAITVVLWGLFTFPRDASMLERHEAAVIQLETSMPEGEAREAALGDEDARFASEKLEFSIAGRLGKLIEPVVAPLGFDWKVGVGLVASFAAREVLVSTLGLVYGLGDGSDEESVPLRDAMRADVRADGTPVHTPLSGLALMVFFVLAMQCMSTLAAVRRETQSWAWPAFQFAYMTALAWSAAFVVFQGGRLLGFS